MATPFTLSDTSFIETIASLCATRLQQRVAFERLRYQTEHDALTGSLSRTSFRARGFAAMRASSAVALLVLNLDNFRHANDTLGQQTGDALLVEVAARLSETATANETVARLGGDSFGILVTNCEGRAEALACATRYLRAFTYPFGTGDRENRERVSLGASIGIALSPDDADGFEILLARADAACYIAKDAGRGGAAFFDVAVEETYAASRHLRNDIVLALARDEFVLYFQPHVDLATRHIGGAEALIRWRHPERGLVEPGAFIPFAERHGLAGSIGAVVETLNVMEALRGAGVQVALDDFGTGYSSLAHLKRLPIDVVKIDRAFVTGLPQDHHDVAIVDAVLSIARSYGFETLAEGIELEDQAAFLRSAGCALGQGYLFGRPMPADAFDTLRRERAGTESP
jgi:Amt family ammonium transporter